MNQIDTYLDELASRLRIAPEPARRLLWEADEHLRDTVEAGVVRGLSQTEAESRAVARFGSAREVARSANSEPAAVAGRALFAAAQLGVAGCIAVFSGALLAEVAARVTSTSWVFGLPAGVTLGSGQVSHWLQVQPGARDWHQAAALENAADSLLFRSALAVFGLIAAMMVVLIVRHRVGRVAAGIVPAFGVAAFGTAAVVLAIGGFTGTFGLAEWGRGQWFSDAAAALIATAVYAVHLRRDLRPC